MKQNIHQLPCERLIQSDSCIFNVLLCPYYHLQIILWKINPKCLLPLMKHVMTNWESILTETENISQLSCTFETLSYVSNIIDMDIRNIEKFYVPKTIILGM